MKKVFIIISLFVFSLTLVGCENTSQEEDPVIKNPIELRENERVDIMQDFDLSNIEYEEATRKFTLHGYVNDSMILQQQKDIRITGRGEPGTVILAKLTKDLDQAESYKNYTIVGQDGKWEIVFPPLDASYYTYTLTLNNGYHEELIEDVLIGEVWIMSGQSNMEMRVREINDAEFTFGNVNEEYIRVFYQRVGDNNASFQYEPKYDVQMGYWKKATSYDNVKDSSGIGFTYAYNLFYDFISQGKQVPIAIINTAKGGSKIQSTRGCCRTRRQRSRTAPRAAPRRSRWWAARA